jgi:two-component system, NtrC family, sensor kinase
MKKHYPKSSLPLSAAEEFLRSLNVLVGLEQVLENVSARFREMLNAGTVYVSLAEPVTDMYAGKVAKGENPERLIDFTFTKADSLIKWLNVNHAVLEVNSQPEVIAYLSERERTLLGSAKIQLVIPLIVVNRLTGALFVSAKTHGEPYRAEDIEALPLLAGQSALAIEHALMFQFQEDKLRNLLHTDKLATVGELAAGAAHEIRNPLTSIRSTIQYLVKELPPGKQSLAVGLIDEVDRIDRIIQGLLTFSKTSELHRAAVNIEDVLTQTLLLLEPEARKNSIEIHRICQTGNSTIQGDAAQLKQVFLNILLNSIQAMPQGGTIEIQTSLADDSRRNLIIDIVDTGTGIPAGSIQKVFDPFYTTKESGTGLGLSISYGIIGKHGGTIALASRAEGSSTGTTVTIKLPRG